MSLLFLENRSNNLSPKKSKPPPLRNPIAAISHGIIFKLSDISIDGERSDQNDAAIITPAANPNIASIIFLLIFLKKKTMAAPSIVILQVNKVAIKACKAGFNSIIISISTPL